MHELEVFFLSLLKRDWFIDLFGGLLIFVGFCVVLVYLMRVIGMHFHAVLHYLSTELLDLIQRRRSIGAINLGGLALVALVLFAVVAAQELKTVLLFLVLQTFLWVSSTLSRMVCKEDVRWTAWSCTGNCLG